MNRRLLPISFALAALGCPPSPDPVPPTPPTAATAEPVDELPLLVKMSAVYNAGDDTEKKFLASHELVNGDRIAYYVSPSKDAYVYVVQFLGGEGHLIYPTDGDAKLAAGEKARVPEDGWFQVFGCAGEEFAYVVASEKPLGEADAELAGILEEIKKSPEPKPECDETGAPKQAKAPKPAEPPKPEPEPTEAPKPQPPKSPLGTAPPTYAVYAKQKPKFLAFATRSLCTRPACTGERALTHVSSVYKGEADESGVAVLEFFFDHEIGKKE